ncbi:hypothetical protein JGH11_13230 [Dysgonomonas sp. Marseille-P4677]|uniref:hypothetical protein n=1 Tax=Dysgonomonas sp. Marseille-P4677 TaxID=2364790 RepID=UPI0019143206|nr:hypothetical protein [Dysgonomonas sp. Marseille-P4677]MBK5721836.1 hypothetical protein [Dysgonomonas sp. Marseille-P4677]
MIYEVKKGDVILEVDDNIFFEEQPSVFRELFDKHVESGVADFDNCNILVLNNKRVIITEKLEEDGKV